MAPNVSRRALLGGVSGAASLAALSGCSTESGVPQSLGRVKQSSGKPNRGGVLRYGLSTDPSNFDPHVSTGAASAAVKQMCYNTVLRYNDKGQIVGDLAKEHGWVNAHTYEITLKDNISFHDGTTLDAQDVVATISRIRDPKVSASDAPYWKEVTKVSAKTSRTVVIEMKAPNVAFPYLLASPDSNVISKRWINGSSDPKISMMGTGPFVFKERVPGVSVTVLRFDDYFESGIPYLNGIEFQPIEDDYSRVAALRSASVDIIDYVPVTHITTLQHTKGVEFQGDKKLGFALTGMVMKKPPFDDVRVRRALAHSIDRSAVLKSAYLGHGDPIKGPLSPSGIVDQHGLEKYPYDPERAKHLMKAAKYTKRELNAVTTSAYSVIDRPAQASLPYLRKSGWDNHLVEQEWLTFRSTVAAKKFPAFFWGTALTYSDPDAVRDIFGSGGAFASYVGLSDSKVDRLLVQGRRTDDRNKRAEIYHDIEERVLNICPFVYTIRRVQGEANRDYIHGFAHPPSGAWTQVSLRYVWMEKR